MPRIPLAILAGSDAREALVGIRQVVVESVADMRANTHIGSDFDDFLRGEGIYGEVTETAMQRARLGGETYRRNDHARVCGASIEGEAVTPMQTLARFGPVGTLAIWKVPLHKDRHKPCSERLSCGQSQN